MKKSTHWFAYRDNENMVGVPDTGDELADRLALTLAALKVEKERKE